MTGAAGAFLDSSPMIVLTGQANSRLLRYEMESGIRQHGTQSLSLEPIVSPIVKYFACLLEPEDTRTIMERAWYEAVSGRRGPVWIDIPVDIQNRQVPEEMSAYVPKQVEGTAWDLRPIAHGIAEARKPLILAGAKEGAFRWWFPAEELMLSPPILRTLSGALGVTETGHPILPFSSAIIC